MYCALKGNGYTFKGNNFWNENICLPYHWRLLRKERICCTRPHFWKVSNTRGVYRCLQICLLLQNGGKVFRWIGSLQTAANWGTLYREGISTFVNSAGTDQPVSPHSHLTLHISPDNYGKCPKIYYTKVANKMAYANNADPDQTALSGAVWSGSTLFASSLCILRNSCIKSKIWAKKVRNKVFEIFGHLPYTIIHKQLRTRSSCADTQGPVVQS